MEVPNTRSMIRRRRHQTFAWRGWKCHAQKAKNLNYNSTDPGKTKLKYTFYGKVVDLNLKKREFSESSSFGSRSNRTKSNVLCHRWPSSNQRHAGRPLCKSQPNNSSVNSIAISTAIRSFISQPHSLESFRFQFSRIHHQVCWHSRRFRFRCLPFCFSSALLHSTARCFIISNAITIALRFWALLLNTILHHFLPMLTIA